jgi:alkaline phosphatase
VVPAGATQPVVDDYGFPDQPMLDEMADKALSVLSKNPNGFVLMVEGASIDKQAHNMDTDRWILETIEFDKAVARCRTFAEQNPDTLVVVTADHECAGINIIGSSRVNAATLASQAANPSYITNVFPNTVGGVATKYTNVISTLRTNVGTYDLAGFPVYPVANDGYPSTMDPDFKMLVGYAASADRFEDYVSNPYPLQDSQQPAVKVAPLNGYPKEPVNRDVAGGTFITGQVNDSTAVHTASDIPVSAFGRGAAAFTGVMDNTDVFFRAMQAVLGGAR